jgi:GT2 family glycosyltransferase
MDISISIVNYNTKNLVKQCVKNIIKSKPNLDYEIIITDSGSKDGSIELIKTEILPRFPQVRLVKSSNQGFGTGHNLGLKNSNAKYIMIINADIVILNDAISQLYSFMQANKQCGIVGPKLIYPDMSVQDSCHAWPKFWTPLFRRTSLGKTVWGIREQKRYDMANYDHTATKQVDWLVGACLLIRKTLWDKINGFDERFFMYCEDIDICRHAWQLNYQVWYYPEARMIHYHKRLSAQKKWWTAVFDKSSRIHLQSHWKYFRKWGFVNAKIRNQNAKCN